MPKQPKSKTPVPVPDYEFWIKMAMWKPAEAIALALGLDPDLDLLDEKGNGSLDSILDKRRRALQRAIETGAFPNSTLIAPNDFLSWMTSNQLEIPAALKSAAKAQGFDIKDWRAVCQQLEIKLHAIEANGTKSSSRGNPEPSQQSLFKIIIGVAHSRYAYNPGAKRNKAAMEIVGEVEKAGLTIDHETVLNALRTASAELDYHPPQSDR